MKRTNRKFLVVSLLLSFTISIFAFQVIIFRDNENFLSEDKNTRKISILGAFNWPSSSQWNILTKNGSTLTDYEERASCADSTKVHQFQIQMI